MRATPALLASIALFGSVAATDTATALTIDFESAPASSGCVQHGVLLTTQGFDFTNASGSDRLFGCDGTNGALGSNGTNDLLDDSGLSDVVMVESSGLRFSLTSFSVSEVFVSDPTQNATSIAVAGFRNGSVVVQTPVLNLDGVIDGPGGAADFQTFILPAGFTKLDKIQIGAVSGGSNGHLFLLDNIAVQVVPEPTTALLLAWGLVAMAARRLAQ